jgi:hypothetical protein
VALIAIQTGLDRSASGARNQLPRVGQGVFKRRAVQAHARQDFHHMCCDDRRTRQPNVLVSAEHRIGNALLDLLLDAIGIS